MPNGYRCDRCSEFVSFGDGPFDSPTIHGPEGQEAHHINAIMDDEQVEKTDHERFHWTLCPRCRRELVNWVEGYE